jgi:hypothetical protein
MDLQAMDRAHRIGQKKQVSEQDIKAAMAGIPKSPLQCTAGVVDIPLRSTKASFSICWCFAMGCFPCPIQSKTNNNNSFHMCFVLHCKDFIITSSRGKYKLMH